ncbi:MAG: beta-N-acetylhexosaminidase [Roseovarius sp.]
MHPGGHAVSRFGATILDADGLKLSEAEKALFAEADPFGFILFARNLDTPDQIYGLCEEMRAAVGREAPILIDQEGGRVQRLRGPRWREWLPPLEHVEAAGDGAAEAMYLRYRLIAHELRAVGVDGNCAPLVDVARDATHDFLKNRCYGFDAGTVARLGRAVADGMLDGGVLPVVKHIPGHGLALVDSHEELPVADVAGEELSAVDFAPFRALNDLPMAMTAHVVYSALDGLPATTSNTVMGCIRKEIGFGGLVMTDDISMKALDGSLADITRDALAAGCDVILHCNGTLDERRAVAEAAGPLSNKGQARAESALAARHEPDEVDIPAMEAKLEALMNGRVYGG